MQPHERYQIVEQIAKGDFATVYRARDLELNREVAIKQIHQQYLDDPTQLERYWQEAQLLASLDHPNIMTIYDIVRERGWLVLELMKGGLQKQLRGQPIDVDFLRLTLIYTLHALHFLHQNGIVHGDVKPGNLLLDKSDRIKLGDFGIARRITGDDGSLLKGTTKYMAPEVVSDQFGPVGPHSDLYSLGFAAFDLLCGEQFESLFPGLNVIGRDQQVAWLMWHAAADRRLPEINRVLEGVPQDLVTVIEKLTQKDPALRYRTAEEAVVDLRTLAQLSEQSPEEVEAARLEEEARKAKRKRVLTIVAVSVSMLFSMGFLLWDVLVPKVDPTPTVVENKLPGEGTLEYIDVKHGALGLNVPNHNKPAYVVVDPQVDVILLNGGQVELKDLRVGDAITIRQFAAGEGKQITATRPEAVAASGRIFLIDSEARKIKIRLENAGPEDPPLEVYLPQEDFAIELNRSVTTGTGGRAVEFADLEKGDKVDVEHVAVADGDGRMATSLRVTRLTTDEGYVIAVDTQKRELKLRLGLKPNSPVRTMPLAEDCPITLNELSEVHGRVLSLGDLRVDDRVTFNHHWQITRIDADRVITHTGNVTRVAYEDRSVFLSLRGQNNPVKFSLRGDCRVTVGEKNTVVELYFVRAGDRVTVKHGSPELDRPQAMALHVARQADRSTWAIVIGQGTYDNDAISSLPHATSDAGSVRDALVEHYRVDENQLLFKPDATRTLLEQDIAKLLKRVKPEDQLIVYFIGNGYRSTTGAAYLATKEFDLDRMEATGLPLRWLVGQMEDSAAKEKILLLDTCHDRRGNDRRQQPSSAELAESLKAGPSRPVSTSVNVVASCDKGERAIVPKDGNRGLFAQAAAEALKCGPDVDKNRDHRVSADELFTALSKKFFERNANARRKQTPVRFVPDAKPARLSPEAKVAIRKLLAFLHRKASRDVYLNAFNDADDLARNEAEPKLAYGLVLLEDGKTRFSEPEFESVLLDDANSLLAHHALAWQNFSTGKLAEGVKHLEKLIEHLPDAEPGTPAHAYAQHVFEWAGKLREYAKSAAEPKPKPEDIKPLDNIDNMIVERKKVDQQAFDKYKAGVDAVRDKWKDIDKKLAKTIDPGDKAKLRRDRRRLTYYTSFDFDVAEALLRATLDQ